MTAIQALIRPSPPAELDSQRIMIVFRLVPIEGALAFDLFSVSGSSKVVWEAG